MSADRRLVCAIALIAAGALAYQLLLMRWLAIAHWHPFAAMIISLALLGHGASGTWLGLWLQPALRRFAWLFPAAAVLFALSGVIAPELARTIPFNGLELVWNPRQLLWLSALYLVLALPFFFAASCFGLAFARHGRDIPRLYGADLLGAGAGAALAVGLLWLPVERGLVLAAACGIGAAMLTAPRDLRFVLALGLSAGLLALLFATRALAPPVNEFKGLSKARQLPGARILAERHGPYGWQAVLESPQVPLRHAPGLSLATTREPAPQLALFSDGDALAVIVRNRADAGGLAYLGEMTSALPYRLLSRPRVLVLGAGGGQDVLQALRLGARAVDVIDANPQRLELVRGPFAAYAGRLYARPQVRTIAADARAYVRASGSRYDLVVLGSGESFAGGSAGVQAASEQYALTVEALRDYRRVLAPGGLLAITRYAKQPPRDELKLWASAIAALRAGDIDPASALAGVRGWDASTLLLRNGRFDDGAIATLRRFADAAGFDPVYHPGVRFNDTNRYNVVEYPYLAEGARTLLSNDAAAFTRDYKFAIAPATDDRPYFGNFFRWRSLPELWRLRAEGGAVLLDSGYLLLLATLLQALPWTLLLVLLPLVRRSAWRAADAFAQPGHDGGRKGPGRIERLRILAYFTALGLAFLIVEIASLSRLTLLVGHPLVAATIGLAGFLVFAGAGSVFAQRLLVRVPGTATSADAAMVRWIRRAVLAIALGLLWQFVVFAAAFDAGAAWPVAARAAVAVIGIAPLAFAMGLPFPVGLARLARTQPALVPWAWGLNGCASVIAAIAALLLAMAIGLRATLLAALTLYALAAWIWPASSTR